MLCDCCVDTHDANVAHTEPVQKDKRGWTALDHAANDNLVDEVTRLLTQDAAAMYAEKRSKTALRIAVENGSVESFLCLMKYDDVSTPVFNYMLHVAVQYGQLGIVDAMIPYCDIVQLHYTLDYATLFGHTHIVRALSRFIPSNFIVGKKIKRTLLHRAAMHNRLDVLQYLYSICSPEIVVTKDQDGDTLLYYAIMTRSFDMVKFVIDTSPQLLTMGIDSKHNPLIIALHYPNTRVIDYILDRHPQCAYLRIDGNVTPLHLVSCVYIAKRLYAMDPTMIDTVTHYGMTPLHFAVNQNNMRLIEYLYMLRPSSISARDNAGDTPFGRALQRRVTVKHMLRMAPNLDEVDSQGNTVLHIAVEHCVLQEDESTLQRVFDLHRKDIKTPNRDGNTPYHIARRYNNQFAIRMLEHNVSVGDLFDIHILYNPLDTSELQRSVTQQCVSLDQYLLPDLNWLVQAFLGTKNKKRKF